MAKDNSSIMPQDIPSEKQDIIARIERVYPNLPLPERRRTIVFIGNEPISWEIAYNEIKNNTSLGNQIGEKLISLKLI